MAAVPNFGLMTGMRESIMTLKATRNLKIEQGYPREFDKPRGPSRRADGPSRLRPRDSLELARLIALVPRTRRPVVIVLDQHPRVSVCPAHARTLLRRNRAGRSLTI